MNIITDTDRLDYLINNEYVYYKPAGYDGRNVGRHDMVLDSKEPYLRDAIDALINEDRSKLRKKLL